MEVEFAEELKKIKTSIAYYQDEQLKTLNLIYLKMKGDLDRSQVKIATLEAENRYNQKLSEDIKQLKTKLNTYQLLFWGFVVALTISFMVYFILT